MPGRLCVPALCSSDPAATTTRCLLCSRACSISHIRMMYSTMRLQHKAQDCGTAASLSLRRQCWASDRCCYEYDSHVSGLWASQGQWVVAGKGLRGECQRLSCKRRLSRTTYLCLQRCGKSVPCPPVRLICIFCACLVPYELVALTHTLTTALILAHTLTHMLQLLHL